MARRINSVFKSDRNRPADAVQYSGQDGWLRFEPGHCVLLSVIVTIKGYYRRGSRTSIRRSSRASRKVCAYRPMPNERAAVWPVNPPGAYVDATYLRGLTNGGQPALKRRCTSTYRTHQRRNGLETARGLRRSWPAPDQGAERRAAERLQRRWRPGYDADWFRAARR